MLLYRAQAHLFTVSCRRVYPFDAFIAAPEAVPNLVDLVEPLIDEALAALQQVPQARPSIGWAYPSKGGGGAFMWNVDELTRHLEEIARPCRRSRVPVASAPSSRNERHRDLADG